MDLGPVISRADFIRMMCPDDNTTSNYPEHGLLKLKGFLPTTELANNAQLMVIKRGQTTGVTVGCATGIRSYISIDDTSIGEQVITWE